jgi:hypothetical protein
MDYSKVGRILCYNFLTAYVLHLQKKIHFNSSMGNSKKLIQFFIFRYVSIFGLHIHTQVYYTVQIFFRDSMRYFIYYS